MPIETSTFTTTAAPDAVFAYFADLRRSEAILGADAKVELTAGAPGEVGATFLVTTHGLLREHSQEWTIKEASPGRRVTYAIEAHQISGTGSYDLVEDGAGTAVSSSLDYTLTGVAKLATPLATLLFKVSEPGMQKKVKAALEEPAPAS